MRLISILSKAAAALIICGALASCANTAPMQDYETKPAVPEITGIFQTDILDIGKADAVILRTAGKTAIIDCGEKGDGKKLIRYLTDNSIKKIDYLFITHFDKDHVGGAAKIIEETEVGRIITPDYIGNNDEYTAFAEAAEKKDITPTLLQSSIDITMEDTLFRVYPPKKSFYKEGDNDYSLVISVTHGENTFLFAGDAEEERLAELPSQLDLKHSFLKLPHHGRYNENTEKFLTAVGPEYSVITCSSKNPADERTVNILKNLGCASYLTQNGAVTVISDGKTINITQSEKN